MLVAYAINNCVGLAIVDAGARCMLMSHNYARELGLRITPAVNGNCGCFGVPGSGTIHDYAVIE